jgi:hypothetical protein
VANNGAPLQHSRVMCAYFPDRARHIEDAIEERGYTLELIELAKKRRPRKHRGAGDSGEYRQAARLAAQVLNALRLVGPTQRPSPTCDDRHSALPPFIALLSLHRRSRRCHVYYLHVT